MSIEDMAAAVQENRNALPIAEVGSLRAQIERPLARLRGVIGDSSPDLVDSLEAAGQHADRAGERLEAAAECLGRCLAAAGATGEWQENKENLGDVMSPALSAVRASVRQVVLPDTPYIAQPVRVTQVVGLEDSNCGQVSLQAQPEGIHELLLPPQKGELLQVYIKEVITGRSGHFRNCFSFAAFMSGDVNALRPGKRDTFGKRGTSMVPVRPDAVRCGEIYLAYHRLAYPNGAPTHAVVGLDEGHCIYVRGDNFKYLEIAPADMMMRVYQSDVLVWVPDGLRVVKHKRLRTLL